MKFSDYEMMLTLWRQQLAQRMTDNGNSAGLRTLKKQSDSDLVDIQAMRLRVDALCFLLSEGGTVEGLTAEQRAAFNVADLTYDAAWTDGMLSAQILGELHWKELGRPYYNIWPSMVRPLERCNLSGLQGKHIQLPVKALVIRLPAPAGTIFYFRVDEVVFLWRQGEQCNATLFGDMTELSRNRLITDIAADEFGNTEDVEPCADTTTSMVAILAGMSLLQQNKDIIEPIVLNADVHRYSQTQDQALVEKAKRKGTFGFNVGRHVETAPGFRQAHFATRWKGSRKDAGGLRPELVPVKGCLVHRKLVTEVPTGYLDKDETVAAVSEGQD